MFAVIKLCVLIGRRSCICRAARRGAQCEEGNKENGEKFCFHVDWLAKWKSVLLSKPDYCPKSTKPTNQREKDHAKFLHENPIDLVFDYQPHLSIRKRRQFAVF